MDCNEVLETARTKIGTKCMACPICNGVACRNTTVSYTHLDVYKRQVNIYTNL